MASLNDLDAQAAALAEGLDLDLDDLDDLDDDDDEELEAIRLKSKPKKSKKKVENEDEDDEDRPAMKKSKKRQKRDDYEDEQEDDSAPPMKKSKKKGPKEEAQDAEDDGEGQLPSKKKQKEGWGWQATQSAKTPNKKKDKAAQNAVCFRYLKGACHFDDCKFQHVNPKKLSNKEQAQILKEIPLRAFDAELAKVIQNMNISKCKDFHQRGECHRPLGQCHFWHLTSASVARWAGFQFWCEVCSKGFTSQDQMDDHCKAAPHKRALAQQKRPQKQKWAR